MGKDDLDAWDDALDDAPAVSLGASKELLRKTLALNPQLRKDCPDSSMLLERLEQMRSGKGGEASAAARPAAPSLDSSARPGLTDVLRAVRSDFERECKAIAAERALLDKREQTLKATLCQRMNDALAIVDPKLKDAKTAATLRQDQSLLDAIGFSVERLVAREPARK